MGAPLTVLERWLAQPAVYDLAQRFLGAKKGRQRFVRNFVRPTAGMKVLDVGCGTAEILDELPQSVEYWGYDVSERYIEAANERYGGRGRFFCRELDVSELDRLPMFDIVLATGLLHHLDDREATEFLHVARGALGNGGRMVSIDPCFAAGQNPVARALISRDRGRHVREAGAYEALAASAFRSVRGVLLHRAWVPYTHWIMECTP